MPRPKKIVTTVCAQINPDDYKLLYKVYNTLGVNLDQSLHQEVQQFVDGIVKKRLNMLKTLNQPVEPPKLE